MNILRKKENGITLVALIVTIIILLILAGITISQLTGNGLFEKAKLAKEEQENSQFKENEILADYENKIGEYVDSSRLEKVGDFYVKPIIKDAVLNSYTIDSGFTNADNIKKLQYYVDDKLVYEGKDLTYTVTNAVPEQQYNVYIKVEGFSKQEAISVAQTVNQPVGYAFLTDNGTLQALSYEEDALGDKACDGNPDTYEEYGNVTRKLKVDSSAIGNTYKIIYTRQTSNDVSDVYFTDKFGNPISGTSYNFKFVDSGKQIGEITVPEGAVEMYFRIDWSFIHTIIKK